MIAKGILALLIAAGILAGSACQNAIANEVGKSGSNRPYQIYFLKGLADIFSSGMDFLQAKLQARGVVGEVRSHAEVESLAQSAIAKWRGGSHGPVIIIGHSLGADAAITMAQRLASAQVPVALLVTFSPMESAPALANVARAVNYFQASSLWHGQITQGAGFHGVLENIDLSQTPNITHFNIEKAEQLHAATIAKVLAIVSPHTKAAAHQPAPPVALRAGFSATSQ
jgi:hypothetical protein